MKLFSTAASVAASAILIIFALHFATAARGQNSPVHMPPNRQAHVLVIGETRGWEHDSVPDAMAAVYRMGHDTGLWETTIRTDTELITKKDLNAGGHNLNRKNLSYFDALAARGGNK